MVGFQTVSEADGNETLQHICMQCELCLWPEGTKHKLHIATGIYLEMFVRQDGPLLDFERYIDLIDDESVLPSFAKIALDLQLPPENMELHNITRP